MNHSKLAGRVLREDKGCLAPNVSSVLPTEVWKGQRCFILCGGPSLEGFDFGPLHNERTIGVNKSFITYPTEVCYAMDQSLYDRVTYSNKKDPKGALLHNQWLKYGGVKVFLKYSGKWVFDPSVYIVHSIKKRILSLDVNVGIFPGNNSGFGALMLAIALGSTEIYLLGCDMKIDRKKGKTHWHDGYAYQKMDQLERVLPKFIEEFVKFSDVIHEQGITVINLNPDSALNCFPKKDIRNIL